MYGPGIYLTEDIRIADSYRTKGDWSARETKIATVRAENKAEGHVKLKQRFVEDNEFRRLQSLRKNNSTEATPQKARLLLEQEFEKKVSEGIITITRSRVETHHLQKVVSRGRDGSLKEEKKIVAKPSSETTGWNFTFKDSGPSIYGWVTSFDFFKDQLLRDTIEIDGQLSPEVFEIFAQKKFWKKVEDYETFLKVKNFGRSNQSLHYSLKQRPLINELREYGIEGYRHTGGWVTGGRRHRVFILFNDEFVNAHRVDVFK